MTLRSLLFDSYAPRRMFDKSPKAVQQYEVAINRFDRWIGRPATLADLSEDAFIAWMQAMRSGDKRAGSDKALSPVTCNMRIKHLLTLWRFAHRRGMIAEAPPADMVFLRVPRRAAQAWTLDEMEAIIRSSRMARGRVVGVPLEKWWPAFVLTLYDTGLRRNAAQQIRFDEIDFERKILRVPAERQKNLVEQYFRLSDQTILAILETLPPRRSLVFPWPFDHSSAMYDRYRRILRRAGLSYTRQDMFHKIRRTTASHIAKHAGESAAMTQLGHRDMSCIQRYVDPRFTCQHEHALLLPRPDWDQPVEVTIKGVAETSEVESPPSVDLRLTRSDLTGADDLMAGLARQETLSGSELTAAIAWCGMTQAEFAAEMQVSLSTLKRLLWGRKPLVGKPLQHARRVLGLSIAMHGETIDLKASTKSKLAEGEACERLRRDAG